MPHNVTNAFSMSDTDHSLTICHSPITLWVPATSPAAFISKRVLPQAMNHCRFGTAVSFAAAPQCCVWCVTVPVTPWRRWCRWCGKQRARQGGAVPHWVMNKWQQTTELNIASVQLSTNKESEGPWVKQLCKTTIVPFRLMSWLSYGPAQNCIPLNISYWSCWIFYTIPWWHASYLLTRFSVVIKQCFKEKTYNVPQVCDTGSFRALHSSLT